VIARLQQVFGALAVTAGAFAWFGLGPALVAAGCLLLLFGVAAEVGGAVDAREPAE
jgi:hypothetical protein